VVPNYSVLINILQFKWPIAFRVNTALVSNENNFVILQVYENELMKGRWGVRRIQNVQNVECYIISNYMIVKAT
jgi:hypothetical protein